MMDGRVPRCALALAGALMFGLAAPAPMSMAQVPTDSASTSADTASCSPSADLTAPSPAADASGPATTGEPLTAGWQVVDVSDAAFSISIPGDWTAVDLTRKDLDLLMARFGESNPQFAALVTSALASGVSLSMVALAPVVLGDPFAANINVIHELNQGYSATWVRDYSLSMLRGLPNLRGDIATEDAIVAGQPGFYQVYRLSVARPDGSSLDYSSTSTLP